MPGQSPFTDEWRNCLRAHYMYVVRAQDKRTLETLTGVLHRVGFRDDELQELAIRATMHVDDMPEDFEPDMTVLVAMNTAVSAAPTAPPSDAPDLSGGAPSDTPAEELIAAVEAAVLAADAVNAPEATEAVVDEISAEEDEAPPADEPIYDPDGPQQMSLF